MQIVKLWVWIVLATFVSGCEPPPLDASSTRDTEIIVEPVMSGDHAPTDLLVLLDTSESMTRWQMELARSFLARLIDVMNADDRFSLMTIASESSVVIESTNATPAAKTVWRRQIDSLEVDGLTNLEHALASARAQVTPETRIVLITDGSPTWGSVAPDELVRAAEALNLVTIGVGRNNERLLRALGRYYYLDHPLELARTLAPKLFVLTPDD